MYPEQVDRWRRTAQDANAKPLVTMAEQKDLRADSKFQNGLGFGCRLTIASSAVMSCITAWIPARVD